jgi:lysophosphatidate acyltransferase
LSASARPTSQHTVGKRHPSNHTSKHVNKTSGPHAPTAPPTVPTMSYLVYFSILLGTMITFLRLLTLVLPAHPAQLLSFYLFTFASFALLLVCSFYGVIASIFLRCVGYGGCSQWTTGRAFKWSMWLFTGVSFNVTGSMKREGGLTGEDALTERPAVFVGNHQSELDVLMLGTMFPQWCSVTAKSSLKWTPFLGWFSTSRPPMPSC